MPVFHLSDTSEEEEQQASEDDDDEDGIQAEELDPVAQE